MRADKVHLTLVFLGDVPAGRIADLMALADAVAGPPFELTIDVQEYWRHNRIVWAGAARCPPPLHDLVTRLVRALRASGFPCDERAYVPHITLLRDARHAPAARTAGSIFWRAGDFALVQSVGRGGVAVYEILKRWPLMPMV